MVRGQTGSLNQMTLYIAKKNQYGRAIPTAWELWNFRNSQKLKSAIFIIPDYVIANILGWFSFMQLNK